MDCRSWEPRRSVILALPPANSKARRGRIRAARRGRGPREIPWEDPRKNGKIGKIGMIGKIAKNGTIGLAKGSRMAGRDIIVIGASAGGVQALQELARGLPHDLPAAVFVVVHTSPTSPGILPQIL